jgi:hypothetical protein
MILNVIGVSLEVWQITFWTLRATRQHTRNFLGVQESAFVMFDGLFFWVLDKLYFCNFLVFLIHFRPTIVSVWDVSRGGLQVLLGHQKQWNLPLGFSLWSKLKCPVTNWSTLDLGLLISWSLKISPKIQKSFFFFLAKCEKMVKLFLAPQKLIFRAYHPTPKYLSSIHFIHPS